MPARKKISVNPKNVFGPRRFNKQDFVFADIATNKTKAKDVAKKLQQKGHKIRILQIKKEIDVFKTETNEAQYVIYIDKNGGKTRTSKKKK